MFLFDWFFIQLIILISIFYINFIKESFYLIINSILFLSFISVYLWFYNLDVYVNFLIIIDLGLFFTMLGFSLNLVQLFGVTNYISILNYKILIIFIILLLNINYFTSFFLILPNTLYSFLMLSFYNWYSLFFIQYSNDLQLLSEIYYNYNFIEFIIMNLLLYIGIFIIFTLINLKLYITKITINSTTSNSKTLLENNFFHIFFKSQNSQTQINQTMTVRVWSRKLNLKS